MSDAPPIFTPGDGQGGGTSAPDWLGTIPEDMTFDHADESGETKAYPLNRHAKLAEFKNPGELGKAYLELQKLNGKLSGGLQPLAEDATDEQRTEWDAKFRTFMGIPDDGDGYEFDFPDEVLEADDRLFSWFRSTAHAVGMSTPQVNEFAKSFYEMSKEYWDEMGTAAETAEADKVTAVADMFKSLKIQPEEGMELAKRGFTALAVKAGCDPAEAEAFSKTFGNDQTFNRLFQYLGAQLKEDDLKGGGNDGSDGGKPVSQSDRYGAMFKTK